MAEIDRHQVGLVCMYRNLKTRATKYPYTLGTFVDVVTQATKLPCCCCLIRKPTIRLPRIPIVSWPLRII